MRRSILILTLLGWMGSAHAGEAQGESTAGSLDGQPTLSPASPAALPPTPLPPAADSFRVASYNIQDFADGAGDQDRSPTQARMQACAAAVLMDEIRPSILIVQEMENGDAVNLLNSCLTRPFASAWVTILKDRQGRRDNHNLAVLSNVLIENPMQMDFGTVKGPGAPTRGAIRFEVPLTAEHRLLVYGVHLKSNFGSRDKNQAQRLHALEFVRADADAIQREHPETAWEILVVGDMNTDPENEEFKGDPTLQPLQGWVDLWRGRPLAERTTCPTRRGMPEFIFPPAAFDRPIVTPALTNAPWVVCAPHALPRGVNLDDNQSKPGRNSHDVSDHYPVYLDILREPPVSSGAPAP